MKVRKAVIPVAGLGTRMLPAAKSVPKEMLTLVDRPVLHYIVEEAVQSGIEDILFVTNRGKAAIEDYFDYSPEIEAGLLKAGKTEMAAEIHAIGDMANVTFVRQKETKGLGHAIWRARDFVGGEPFAVLLGDDVMSADVPVTRQLINAADEYGASAVAVHQVPLDIIGKYCSLKVEPLRDNIMRMLDVVEKPAPEEVWSPYAILGRYVLAPEIFGILETTPPGRNNEIQLTDAIRALSQIKPVTAVDFLGVRYDAGDRLGYLKAVVELALKHDKVGEGFAEYLKSLKL